MTIQHLVRVFPLLALFACGGTSGNAAATTTGSEDVVPVSVTPRQQDYRVVNSFPHDPSAWTQGLVFLNGSLYEGTGKPDSSYLREVEITSGRVIRQHKLDKQYFGEGIAVVGDKIYQLTWQNHKGFIYELSTFKEVGEWEYDHEGWGITYDGTNLIISDGTPKLRFLNPRTLATVRTVDVRDNGVAVENINELEMVKGEIFANIWLTDKIARIDPATGQVTGWLNLAGLLPESERNRYQNVDVLNGIAYDPAGDRLFVTGKWWPKLYEIKLVPVE